VLIDSIAVGSSASPTSASTVGGLRAERQRARDMGSACGRRARRSA
jgi:hypothetical protein